MLLIDFWGGLQQALLQGSRGMGVLLGPRPLTAFEECAALGEALEARWARGGL